MNSIFKSYYRLTKPGIIYSNAITSVAGFFLASKGHINLLLLVTMAVGTSLIIASACVFNNYIDRNIDKKMDRTKNRALVTGAISGRNAILYATVLGILGILTLAVFTNFLTVGVGLIGFIDYVVLYGLTKRRTTYGTLVGSISGAMPLVAGYTSVTNRFDLGALVLFFILSLWQMPHFYAIAIYRLKDYTNAGIPVLPVKKGIFITKIHMAFYTLMFCVAVSMLTVLKYTGYIYLAIALSLGLIWLGVSVSGFWTKDSTRWARKMFFFSLIIVLILSVMISVGNLLV